MKNTIELTKTVHADRWGKFFDEFSERNRGRYISITDKDGAATTQTVVAKVDNVAPTIVSG